MDKVFLDSSCLIAAFHSQHAKHKDCLHLVREIHGRKRQGFLAAHSLAEVFSVLTRLPGRNRVPPDMAAQLLESNIVDIFKIIALTGPEYIACIKRFSNSQLGGGLIYDGLILAAAEKAKVDSVYTLNARHFTLIPSTLSAKIVEIA